MDMPLLEERGVTTLSSSEEESDAESHEESLEGTNSQQGDSSRDVSDTHVNEETITLEHKQVVETEAKASEDEGKVPPQSSDVMKPSSSNLYEVESPAEIIELDEHVSDDITETSMEYSPSFQKERKARDMESESLTPYTDVESKPSSSKTRNAGLELAEIDELEHTTTKDEYVKKGFTCDSNSEEEEDDELREYWTRALQTSTSTGEVVEEIVKVLKHHQKSHDLLCPVCGSCVTRRVILRKRKRSSLISVDRWYRDPLDDEAEVPERSTSAEVNKNEEEDKQEYHDTEAFGCLACFSLFFSKGRQLWSKIQAEVGPDTFNCLPFFFPPYPWGMTQRRRGSLVSLEEAPILPEIVESEFLDTQDVSTSDVETKFTCGVGSMVLPDYPWGTMPYAPQGLQEAPILQETEEINTHHTSTTDVRPDYTCGLGSKLLPDFPWGTMPPLSKEEVIESTDQTKDGIGLGSRAVGDEPPAQDIAGSCESEDRTCACGLAPALIPAFPWGVYTKSKDDVGLPQAEDTVNEEVQQEEAEGLSQSQREEPSCSCELAPALLPEYPWGYMSKGKENFSIIQPEDIAGVGQSEVEEISTDLQRKGRSCTCGLVPALLPNYPWGYFAREEVAALSDVEARIEPDSRVVDVNEPILEYKWPHRDLVSAVLPDYPWGTTAQEEVIEGPSIPGEKSNRRKRKAVFRNGFHLQALEGAGSTILPRYPWGICSVKQSVHEQIGGAQMDTGTGEWDCSCGLGSAMLPTFPWGQTHSTDGRRDQTGSKNLQSYVEQETKIEARITSKTDVYTVTASKTTYPGEQPPKEIKAIIPNHISQTIESVKLDQTVTVLTASLTLDEPSSGVKGGTRLPSLPSTGYALLECGDERLPGNGRLETNPSTGYACLEEVTEGASSSSSHVHFQEDEDEYSGLKVKEIEEDAQSVPEEKQYKDQEHKPRVQPTVMQFPTFQWAVGKVDAGDLTMPLLKASVEPEGETFISVLKPSSGPVEETKSDNWLSVFKVSRPPDDESITAPLLSKTAGYKEEIQEEIHTVAQRPQVPAVTEAVITMPPSSTGPAVGTTATSAVALAPEKKKDADGWDILKSIVYGGLDISIASLGVTSSAAGGNAITRTVVYMGLATLVSGLIGFYHNVLNLYHYHRDHYTDMVGLSLFLHGTLALVSYIVFGALSPLIYALSYRKTDSRDDKFILCCGVTVVTVTALALGKAKVSTKRYLRTPFAYLSGGVLAAVVGYLTGEHVSELLEQWGL